MNALFEIEINRRRFRLVENSLLAEKVEAIVNPANEHLLHGGGVAGMIARQGGSEIQRESDRQAPVRTGRAVFTGAGKLPFRYVIHTVGPVWRGGGQGEPELLYEAIHSALQVAAELGIVSLSLPAVSTGIFGYPLEKAIPVILRAVEDFLCLDSSLKTVQLCEFSREKAAVMAELVAGYFAHRRQAGPLL